MQWIVSEDLNIEHLFDIFTSIVQNTVDIWGPCVHFLQHLYWHKPRQTVLRPRIEGLPDSHLYKPKCLFTLSMLFQRTGNHGERKKLLVHTLELQKQRGDDDFQIAQTLIWLSDVNRLLELYEEGIQQAREALEIYERKGYTIWQGDSLDKLTWLLLGDKQLDEAENAASQIGRASCRERVLAIV